MDSLSFQYNVLYGALLRVFGDRVELIYVDASSETGRREVSSLEAGDDLKLPLVTAGDKVLFSGRVPVAKLIRHVRQIVTSRKW